jgi:hypothetical protein
MPYVLLYLETKKERFAVEKCEEEGYFQSTEFYFLIIINWEPRWHGG